MFMMEECGLHFLTMQVTFSGFNLEKWTRGGGQNNTLGKFRGGEETVHDSMPSRDRRRAPNNFFEF